MKKRDNKNKINTRLLDLAIDFSERSYKDKHLDATVVQKDSIISYIFKQKSMDILVFRGSDDIRDWTRYNLVLFPKFFRNHLCHRGFVKAHTELIEEIKKGLTPGKPLLICGHSAGGALAEITAFALQKTTLIHLITFGKPNLFLRFWRPRLDLDTNISVISAGDPMSVIPRYFYGPSRNQELIFITEDNKVYFNPKNSLKKTEIERKPWKNRGKTGVQRKKTVKPSGGF